MNILDVPEYAAADALLASLKQQLADAKRARSAEEPSVSDGLAGAKAVYLAGGKPERIDVETGRGSREQLDLRIVALGRAVEEQKRIVHLAAAAARRRLIEANDLAGDHEELLQGVANAAKVFGAACSQLDTFYSELESSGIGGAALGHFGWPMHPGLATDSNSNHSAFLREVKRGGYEVSV